MEVKRQRTIKQFYPIMFLESHRIKCCLKTRGGEGGGGGRGLQPRQPLFWIRLEGVDIFLGVDIRYNCNSILNEASQIAGRSIILLYI